MTGGISYRLKLGYQLAKLLIKLHRAGILINTLSPDLIFVDSYKAESPITNIEIAVTENVSTYSRKPLYAVLGEYADPMIGRKMTVQTTYSDTYAFAVTLFSLLTLCHPFKGEQHENLPREKQYEFILTGSLDYIGDPEGENYSDLYEDNQVFLSSELKALFLRTFKDGKFDHTLRPSLQEYSRVLRRLLNFGDSFDEVDEDDLKNYRLSVLPVTQTDVGSIQRLMKLISLQRSVLMMEWQSEQQTKCPICQEDNIHRTAQNSWKCDNLSCGVEWGKTRCTTKCKEWFYWIQPGSDMVKKLRFQDVQCDTPCEAIQMHENIFDRYVITDFEIEPDEGSGNVKIYPICPICGGRRKR